MSQTEELSEEDLMDDLITLVGNAVEPGIDVGNLEDEEDCIQIVSSTQDDSILQNEVSWYGKRSVVPVTFFNNARNIRLLSKCQPMSVQIVDCDKSPWYYDERTKKPGPKSRQLIKLVKDNDCADSYKIVESFTDVTNSIEDRSIKCTDAVNELSDDEVVYIPISKNDSDSVGESYKIGTDVNSGTIKPINQTELNFKKNTGLIGMKVSSTIRVSEIDTKNTKDNISNDQKTKSSAKEVRLHLSNEKDPRFGSAVVLPSAQNLIKSSTMVPKAERDKVHEMKKNSISNFKKIRQQTVKKLIYLDSLRDPKPVKKKSNDIRSKIKSQRHKLHASMIKTTDDGNTSPILPCPSLSKKKTCPRNDDSRRKESQSTKHSCLVLGKPNTSNGETSKHQATDSSQQAVDRVQTSLLEQLIATMSKPPPHLSVDKEQMKVSVIVKPLITLPQSMPILEDEVIPNSLQAPNQLKIQTPSKIVSSVSSKIPSEDKTVSKTTWDADLRMGRLEKKLDKKPVTNSTEKNDENTSHKTLSEEIMTKPSKCIVFSKTSNPTSLNKPEPRKVASTVTNQNQTKTNSSETMQIVTPTMACHHRTATINNNSETVKTMSMVNQAKNITTSNYETTQKVIPSVQGKLKVRPLSELSSIRPPPCSEQQRTSVAVPQWTEYPDAKPVQNMNNMVALIENPPANKQHQNSANDQWEQMYNEFCRKNYGQKYSEPYYQENANNETSSLHAQRRQDWHQQWQRNNAALQNQLQNNNMNAHAHYQHVNISRPEHSNKQRAFAPPAQSYNQGNDGVSPHLNYTNKLTSPNANCCVIPPPPHPSFKGPTNLSQFNNFNNQTGQASNVIVPQMINYDQLHMSSTQTQQNIQKSLLNGHKQCTRTNLPTDLDTYYNNSRNSMHPNFPYTLPPPPRPPPPPPPPPPLQPAKEHTSISTPEKPVPLMQVKHQLASSQQNVSRQHHHSKPAVLAEDGARKNLVNIPLTAQKNNETFPPSVPCNKRPFLKRGQSFQSHTTTFLIPPKNEEQDTPSESSLRVDHPYANAIHLSVQPKTNISLRRRLSVDANCSLTTPYNRTPSSTTLLNADLEKKPKGYSPPILPIPTVERSLRLLSAAQAQEKQNDLNISRTPKRPEDLQVKPGPQSLNVKHSVKYKRCAEKRESIEEMNEEVKKKITMTEYLKRLSTEGKCIDLTKGAESPKQNDVQVAKDRKNLRKRSNSGNLSDLGYDSDSTVKL